eukprot:481792-Hanusia_phi.AAC.1
MSILLEGSLVVSERHHLAELETVTSRALLLAQTVQVHPLAPMQPPCPHSSSGPAASLSVLLELRPRFVGAQQVRALSPPCSSLTSTTQRRWSCACGVEVSRASQSARRK